MPTLGTSVFGKASFASTLDITVNFGSSADRGCLVWAWSNGNSGGTTPTAAVIDPAGANLPMTAGANRSGATVFAAAGNLRAFYLASSSVPTGSKTVRITFSDNNTNVEAWVVPLSDATAIAAPVQANGSGTSFSSGSVSSASGRVAYALVAQYNSGIADPVTPTSPTVKELVVSGSETNLIYLRGGAILSRSGGSSITLAGTLSAGFEWAVETFDVTGAGGPPPTIDTQPAAQTVTAPAAATFSVAISGTYTGVQWEYSTDGGASSAGNVPGGTGATTTSYTTGATAVSTGSYRNGYRYRAAIAWSGGTVYSNWATLTVNAAGTAPSISTQPANQSVTVGATATFSVLAVGSGTLTYQWQRQPAAGGGYSDISGATASSYTTPATTISGGAANNGDTYRCVVTGDTAPAATSTAAALTVQQPLATTVSFTVSGGVSLSGVKGAVFDQVTPDLWAAPVKKFANGTTDAAGLCTIDVTGVTARRIGELGSVFLTNCDGTSTAAGTQAATRRGFYIVATFS